MHVIFLFYLAVGLFNGFHPVKEVPKEEFNFLVAEQQHVVVRTFVKPFSAFEFEHIVKQTYDYSCGSAALATLLNYYLGESFDEREVIAGLLKFGNAAKIEERRAFSLLDFKKFVNVLGYKGAGYKAEIKDLRELKRPGIVPITLFGYRHFVVLKGIYADHVFLADPWRGNISFTLNDFKNHWYQQTLFLIDAKGARELNLLLLKDQDLRYIDEDSVRNMMFDPTAYDRLVFRENLRALDLMEVKGAYEYYKR